MIISCEKCDKKFELSDELIPEEGRLLQCGSCSYQWHYIPTKIVKLTNEIDPVKKIKYVKKTSNKQEFKKIKKNTNNDNANISIEKKGIGFLSIFIAVIISLIALLIIADTFKIYIVSFIPNIDFYLSSLYESLKDISLFFKDLIK